MPGGETVRVGVIGAGLISAYHLAGLAAAGGAEVRVLAARSTARAGPLAGRFGVPEVATDWRAVLERPDIDAVVIATPDNTHEEMAVAAARAGKAVLLQKPMAMSSAGCQRIIAAARAAGVDLQVSWMHRHFEAVVHARELLASGRLGPVHHVRIRNATAGPHEPWFFDRARVAGGVVMQLGVHGIDLVRHLFGEIGAVSATAATVRPERTFPGGLRVACELEDEAHAVYRFAAGGVLGGHEMSFNEARGTDRFRLEVYGAEGTLLLRTSRGPLAVFAPRATGAAGWFVPELPQRAFGERHHARWLDIVRGRVPSDPTAADALAGTLVAEAVYRSAASRREETVEALDLGD
ncbi:MAG TPA: Gfo/Idh/MocA family oxidoreductase [Geminicoccaceae bacterium]|nr:Gfo/Idh/MocA family oxidoreductase [Geminicoccaceae bacterium]